MPEPPLSYLVEARGRDEQEFFDWLRLERGRSHNTLIAYRRDIGAYFAWLDSHSIRYESVTSDEVRVWMRSLQGTMAPRTVARKMASVGGFYRYFCAEHGRVNPFDSVELPRQPLGVPKPLSASDVSALIDGVTGVDPIDIRDRSLLEVMYGTGIRVSEVCGLDVGDVDMDGRLMRVIGKGNRQRQIPLGRPAWAQLAQWFDSGRPHWRGGALTPKRGIERGAVDALFVNFRGGRLTRQGVYRILADRALRSGIDRSAVSPHVLRHSFATHMIDGGADVRVVQELLGHVSISTTQVYTSVASSRLVREYERAHPRSGWTPP